MKKRALMALPKLTATDEMKQIAASDLPRKEKTTYGYVREVYQSCSSGKGSFLFCYGNLGFPEKTRCICLSVSPAAPY